MKIPRGEFKYVGTSEIFCAIFCRYENYTETEQLITARKSMSENGLGLGGDTNNFLYP